MRYGSAWAECDICGEEYPQSEMVRHYKTGRLVDVLCADELNADDYREVAIIRAEELIGSEQIIPAQGQQAAVGYGDYAYGDQDFGDP